MIRSLRRISWVKVDVDYIIESPNGNLYGLSHLLVIERTIEFEMRVQNNRTKVANGGLIVPGIESDFRT